MDDITDTSRIRTTPYTNPLTPPMAGALRRIRELEMENEVLRRAAAYLSQANLKSPK